MLALRRKSYGIAHANEERVPRGLILVPVEPLGGTYQRDWVAPGRFAARVDLGSMQLVVGASRGANAFEHACVTEGERLGLAVVRVELGRRLVAAKGVLVRALG